MRPKVLEDPPPSRDRAIPVTNYMDGSVMYDTLYPNADKSLKCNEVRCRGSHITQWDVRNEHSSFCSRDMIKKAQRFLKEFYKDHGREKEFYSRWEEIMAQLTTEGNYDLTTEELEYAVKLGWRNSTRCSARIQWNKLVLLDRRHDVHDKDGMFKAICEHIAFTTNGGALRPAITVFRQRKFGTKDLRIWNIMMLSYAGYLVEEEVPNEDGDGTIKVVKKIGDQGNLEFTQFCQRLGWKGKGTPFDILPIVLSDDGVPKFYDIPEELILMVPIIHPRIKAITNMGLKWYALPMVAGLMFEAAGLQFPAAPFAGWYTSVEIATRDLLEPNRYDLMDDIGRAMGLDMSNNSTLWKDQVALEMNRAILHSFKLVNATIVDQHTVSEQFLAHLKEEYRTRGGCPTDWVWVVPSQSGSLTPLYHQEMLHYHLSPCYERQDVLWKVYRFPEDGEKRLFKLKTVVLAACFATSLYKAKMSKRPQVQIYYGTETGTAKKYAEKLRKMFSHSFNVTLLEMDQYSDGNDHKLKGICFFITSTFGNGDPPAMAAKMASWLDQLATKQDLTHISSKIGLNTKLQTIDEKDDAQAQDNDKKIVSKSLNRRSMALMRKLSVVFQIDLATLKYGVFALGSTAYPNYCGFGKWLDNTLNTLRGMRMLQVGLGDELGDRDGEFRKWSRLALQKACIESGLDMKDRSGADDAVGARFKVVTNVTSDADPNDMKLIAKSLSDQHGHDVILSTLVQRRALPATEGATILVRLQLPRMVPYQPGDHVAVFPVNNDSEVQAVLDHLTGLPPNVKQTVIRLQEQQQTYGWENSALPPTTLWNLLKYHLCLRTTPSMDMLEFLSEGASGDEDRKKLKSLASDYGAYSYWKVKEPSVVDTLQEFASIRVDAAELAFRLLQLRPRFYSVASSPNYRLDLESNPVLGVDTLYADLLLNVVEYKTSSGHNKKGFCSNFLFDVPLNSSVAVFIRACPSFKLPPNHEELPIVLIGAGSGMAPFRGFWQHVLVDSSCTELPEAPSRKSVMLRRQRAAKIQLFFGCFDQTSDLLQDETEVMSEFLARYSAYSREPGQPKTYVQDLIKQYGSVLLQALVAKRGHLFVCGKVTMAEEVHQALVQVIADAGDIEPHTALSLLDQMKEEGRYSRDIFGQ